MVKRVVLIRKTSILFLVLLLNSNLTFAQNTIDITYIANSGFLITGKNEKVLIDAIFSEGGGKYHIPTQQILSKERKASSPFNNLSVILVSHNHPDHINMNYVTEHMTNDEKSFLICPLQVGNELTSVEDYNTVKDRIINITPGIATKVDTLIQKISFKIFSIPHANDSSQVIENLGFVFSINGFKIFHPGDAVSSNLSTYKSLNLAKDSIDIAFLPRWFFTSEYGKGGSAIIDYLKPKAIIMMHTNSEQYNKNIIKTKRGNLFVYLMDIPMGKLTFNKDNGSITDTL